MHKIYKMSDDAFIAYKYHKSKNNLPCVVFLHGLMSDMTGTKAEYLYDYCILHDISFLALDNFGCGNSSGKFQDQTMGIWHDAAKQMIQIFAPSGAILIGSSAGAWTALSVAETLPNIVKGLICVAAAPDFTEDIWEKLSHSQQENAQKDGVINVDGYSVAYHFIQEAKKHLLLTKDEISITCPVHLIHGAQDIVVSYALSNILYDKIVSQHIVLKLVKDGDHKLTRTSDLKMLSNSLDEILHLSSSE